MAITVIESPQQYTPSDNPVTWVFSSDQTAQPNFHFLVEVYLSTGGLSFDLISRHKVYPESGTKAHFNAQSITQRYCKLLSTDITFETVQENNQRFRLKIIERFGTPLVDGANFTTPSTRVWKAKLRKADFIGYDFNDYMLKPSTSDTKFLTLFPRDSKYKVSKTEKLFFSKITNGDYFGFTVAPYDANGASLAGDAVYGSVSGDVMSWDVSPSGLKSKFPVLDLTNWDRYDIAIVVSGGFSEIFRIWIDNDCTYSESKRLHFLNSLGGIDAFTFGLFSRESHSVTSHGYEKQFGGFDSSSNYSFSLEGGSTVDYLKQFQKSLEVTSDWLTQDVQNWLSKELYTSPCVWLEEDGKLKRVKVTNNGFNKKVQENDMLFQEVVTIELENDSSVTL